MFYYSLSLDGLIEFGAFTDKNGEVAVVHFGKCLSDRHANNNANVEWNSHFILISILNDPAMTCSGVQLIGTFTTREDQDQGREHLEMLSSNCHAAGFFSSCGDWISLKMGNLLKKKNESFELEMKNYNAHETRVFTIFARCSFHILIYYFHFNEQCTSSILSVWGRVFWWLQRWCCVCFEGVQKNWKRANTVLYLNMISMSHMMKSTICMLLHIGKLATIILHFKIKIFGMRLCVCVWVCGAQSLVAWTNAHQNIRQPTQKFVLCSEVWSFCKNIFQISSLSRFFYSLILLRSSIGFSNIFLLNWHFIFDRVRTRIHTCTL